MKVDLNRELSEMIVNWSNRYIKNHQPRLCGEIDINSKVEVNNTIIDFC